MVRSGDIRSMYEGLGQRGFLAQLQGLLEGRDPNTGTSRRKVSADEFSLRSLWEGLVGPCDDTMAYAANQKGFLMQEAVDSTAFANATGVLINAKILEGYDGAAQNMIGDELVTNVPSKLKRETYVGFTSLEGPEQVSEGMPYNESSFEEKYVTSVAEKKGRILEITEEAVFFDQTGQILQRASRLGEMAREEKEETILAGVVDITGGTALGRYQPVYRPSGTAAALYSTANNNYLSTATPLVDWTDIDEVLRYHAENQRDDRAVSGDRRPIIWMPRVLLVSRKLAGTAARILNATETRSGPAAAAGDQQTIAGNPLPTLLPGGFRVLHSPLLDYLAGVTSSAYDDSDDWFVGDFKKAFGWQDVWPLQTLRAPQNDDAQFRRDIIARFKVRYFGAILAWDTKWVVKVNAV